MFSDVRPGMWFYEALNRVIKRGVVSGYGDGTFRPDCAVTRAEVVSMLDRMNVGIAQAVEQLAPSVIEIRASDGPYANGRSSLGSGVVLDKDGHIATNMHVIWYGVEGGKIDVRLDSEPNTPYLAEWIAGDMVQDLSIIKINIPPEKLRPVKLAGRVLWGEEILCIGHPVYYRNTITRGCISYKHRLHTDGRTYHQTDASINPGNSGGGAFNLCRELVGIPTWKMVWVDETMSAPVTNIGFLVPVDAVWEMYQDRVLQGKAGLPAGQSIAAGVKMDIVLGGGQK
jgi:S1-C subfamily serine protease